MTDHGTSTAATRDLPGVLPARCGGALLLTRESR